MESSQGCKRCSFSCSNAEECLENYYKRKIIYVHLFFLAGQTLIGTTLGTLIAPVFLGLGLRVERLASSTKYTKPLLILGSVLVVLGSMILWTGQEMLFFSVFTTREWLIYLENRKALAHPAVEAFYRVLKINVMDPDPILVKPHPI